MIINNTYIGENKKIFPYPCSDSSFCYPIEIFLRKGSYLLEVWGASGGYSEGQTNQYTLGKGGYSRGVLKLSGRTKLFLNVGGAGKNGKVEQSETIYGGYNGGGNVTGTHVGSGGGASDIRIGTNSLHRRIIVAGGGGGLEHTIEGGYGGAGGGELGIDGFQPGYPQLSGGGGTRSSGGSHQLSSGQPGFGYGGSSTVSSTGGGGGGWYGGGASHTNGGNGGGGSGYVFNISTWHYDEIFELDSTYFLTDSFTVAGDNEFLSPFGELEIGHEGNGFISITSLTNSNCSKECKHYLGFFSIMVIIFMLF